MPETKSSIRALTRLSQGRLPWRLQIARCFLIGLFHSPKKALRYGKGLTLEMKTVMRFNLHIHGEKFLKDFLDCCHSLDMKPFLVWGTLLGCIREGKFLDHDDDLDVGILEADYPKKDALIRAMLKKGYRLRHDVPFKFSFERKDGLLQLDVDVLYRHKELLINFMPMEGTGEPWSHYFPVHAFDTLQSKPLGSLPDVGVPGDYEAVLETCYGNWRVPQKNYSYTTGPRCKIQDPTELGIGPDNMPWKKFEG